MASVHMIPWYHPYIEQLRVTVHHERDGWVVDWRDFSGVRQEVVFNTQDEARRFAASAMLGPHTWNDDEQGPPYDECDAMWRGTKI